MPLKQPAATYTKVMEIVSPKIRLLILFTYFQLHTLVSKLKQVMVLERKHPPQADSVIDIVLHYLSQVWGLIIRD